MSSSDLRLNYDWAPRRITLQQFLFYGRMCPFVWTWDYICYTNSIKILKKRNGQKLLRHYSFQFSSLSLNRCPTFIMDNAPSTLMFASTVLWFVLKCSLHSMYYRNVFMSSQMLITYWRTALRSVDSVPLWNNNTIWEMCTLPKTILLFKPIQLLCSLWHNSHSVYGAGRQNAWEIEFIECFFSSFVKGTANSLRIPSCVRLHLHECPTNTNKKLWILLQHGRASYPDQETVT